MTIKEIVVEAVSAPLEPFTVSEYGPAATLAPTLMVATEVPEVGFVPKVPVTPVGQPAVASVTAALKPFTGVTLTVDIPLAPVATLADVALSVKLG